MNTLTKIYALSVGLMLLYPIVILCIQVSAFRKLRHKCFALLCISTAFVFVYSIAALVPSLLKFPEQTAISIFYFSMVPFVLSMVFGIWGMLSLISSYKILASQFK